jgi:hypothetical protein
MGKHGTYVGMPLVRRVSDTFYRRGYKLRKLLSLHFEQKRWTCRQISWSKYSQTIFHRFIVCDTYLNMCAILIFAYDYHGRKRLRSSSSSHSFRLRHHRRTRRNMRERIRLSCQSVGGIAPPPWPEMLVPHLPPEVPALGRNYWLSPLFHITHGKCLLCAIGGFKRSDMY